MSNNPLVQPLPDGDLDIVGDVHGEIEALCKLMEYLGYDLDGSHPAGRRLVFLGDLTDRGPDSLAVVDRISELINLGRAQCVLGNHDLNLLLEHSKKENQWFFGHCSVFNGVTIPQRLASGDERCEVIGFFETLPLVLERPGLRIVHACWRPEMVDTARMATDVKELYDCYHDLIEADNRRRRNLDKIDMELQHQNRNPVKLLTSGPEERAEKSFKSEDGTSRNTPRVQWWMDYHDPETCVFGHYAPIPGRPAGAGRAICVDYGVGRRWRERLGLEGSFAPRLAALQFPELRLIFDDGQEMSVPNA